MGNFWVKLRASGGNLAEDWIKKLAEDQKGREQENAKKAATESAVQKAFDAAADPFFTDVLAPSDNRGRRGHEDRPQVSH